MPDRSLRLRILPTLSARGGERGTVLLRERPSTPPDAPSGGDDGRGGTTPGTPEDNPFAPPAEGTPDQPWRPRHPGGQDSGQGNGQGQGHGQGQGQGPGGGPSPWGSQWSDRQPGRSPGGFGERPQRPGGPEQPGGGPGGPGGPGRGSGMRWDPTDPAQRRARFSLLAGMWAVFFVLFGWSPVALLLGALALYWGISALRSEPRRAGAGAGTGPAAGGAGRPQVPGQFPGQFPGQAPGQLPGQAPGQVPPQGQLPPGVPQAGPGAGAGAGAGGNRPQLTAAISGLVTASLALALVLAGFAAQFVYRDYYSCVNDSLTHQAQQSCDRHLPQELRGMLGTDD
nr:hypothetical protein [Streptomyces sp. Tu 6176]